MYIESEYDFAITCRSCEARSFISHTNQARIQNVFNIDRLRSAFVNIGLLCSTGGGGGVNFHYKDIYTDVRLDWVYFSGLQVHEWVSFSLHKSIGYLFHPKVYEWVKFEK